MKSTVLLAAVLVLAVSAVASAAPQWGSQGHDAAQTYYTDTATPAANWTRKFTAGVDGPVCLETSNTAITTQGNLILITGHAGNKLQALCVSGADGSTVWSTKLTDMSDDTGSCPFVLVDDNNRVLIFAISNQGPNLPTVGFALDGATGKMMGMANYLGLTDGDVGFTSAALGDNHKAYVVAGTTGGVVNTDAVLLESFPIDTDSNVWYRSAFIGNGLLFLYGSFGQDEVITVIDTATNKVVFNTPGFFTTHAVYSSATNTLYNSADLMDEGFSIAARNPRTGHVSVARNFTGSPNSFETSLVLDPTSETLYFGGVRSVISLDSSMNTNWNTTFSYDPYVRVIRARSSGMNPGLVTATVGHLSPTKAASMHWLDRDTGAVMGSVVLASNSPSWCVGADRTIFYFGRSPTEATFILGAVTPEF